MTKKRDYVERRPRDHAKYPDADHTLSDAEISARYQDVIDEFVDNLLGDPAAVADLAEGCALVAERQKRLETLKARRRARSDGGHTFDSPASTAGESTGKTDTAMQAV